MKLLTAFILFISFGVVAQSEDWEVKADSVMEIANTQLGVSYKYGTCRPNTSFDCSGFVSYVYNSCGIDNSRSSRAYGNLGEEVKLSECRKGDCILFAGTQPGSKTIGHVGIVVENNEDGIKFIHCSSSKNHFGVVVTDYYNSGYPKRFIEVRRMF